jgi:hypothetical protein
MVAVYTTIVNEANKIILIIIIINNLAARETSIFRFDGGMCQTALDKVRKSLYCKDHKQA